MHIHEHWNLNAIEAEYGVIKTIRSRNTLFGIPRHTMLIMKTCRPT